MVCAPMPSSRVAGRTNLLAVARRVGGPSQRLISLTSHLHCTLLQDMACRRSLLHAAARARSGLMYNRNPTSVRERTTCIWQPFQARPDWSENSILRWILIYATRKCRTRLWSRSNFLVGIPNRPHARACARVPELKLGYRIYIYRIARYAIRPRARGGACAGRARGLSL